MTTTFTPVTLTGSSASSGSASFALLLLTPVTMSGSSASSGTATITQNSIAGAFDDFALVAFSSGSEYSDPQITAVTDITVRKAPSDTVNAWQRVSITASAPTDYTPGPAGLIYNRAAYARLTINTDVMPISSTQYVTYLQFEQTPGNGKDQYSDRTGINLLSLDQASYEGRLYYQAAALDGGESFARTNTFASCGTFSGLYTYTTPLTANTYTNLQLWGSYTALKTARATYSSATYNPPPGSPVGSGSGQTVFTVNPTPEAYARVQGGTFLVAQIAIATLAAGSNVGITLLQYDVNGAQIASTNSATTAALGSLQWQTITMSATLMSTAVYAAVVPRVTTGSAVTTMTYYVDEHRLFVPASRNQSAVGTSPARAWQAPKTAVIKPTANRINLCQNPGFYNDLAGWVIQLPSGVAGTWSRNTTGGFNGGACGAFKVITMPTASLIGSGATPWMGIGTRTDTTVASMVAIDLVPAGTRVTYSAYVRHLSSALPITIWAHDGHALVRGTSSPIQPPGTTGFVRLSVTVTTTADFGGPAIVNVGYAASDVNTLFQAVPPGTNTQIWQDLGTTGVGSRGTWSATTTYSAADTVNDAAGNLYSALVQNGPWTTIGAMEFYLDQVLAEVTSELRPYFDGNSPSSDYMWEPPTDTRPATGETRSHYYRGKTVNQYRLDRAIKRSLPVGASYQIVYAAPPS
jgi:hypothetical protein